MTRVKTYGPPPGAAGAALEVRYGNPPASESPVGTTCIVAAFPKGDVNKVMDLRSRAMAQRRLGRLVETSYGPLCRDDFYAMAGDVGAPLLALRVTDGLEVAAWTHLYDRNVEQSYSPIYAVAKVPNLVAKVSAQNAGTWGGQYTRYGGHVGSMAGAISGANFTTGLSSSFPFTKNALKGATLHLQGETRTWEIASNTAAGVITVKGDFTGYTTTDTGWWVTLDNVDSDGDDMYCSLIVKDGSMDPEDCFALHYKEDGYGREILWDDLEMDTEGKRYFEDTINKDLSNYEITMDDEFTGDETLPKSRPANFAEMPITVADNVLHFRIAYWKAKAGNTGNGYVAQADMTYGANVIAHKYVLTVKSGATTFTVACYDYEGDNVIASGCADGTIDAAYTAPFDFLAGFKLTNGTTPFVENDVIYLYVRPLPVGLKGSYFYPYAFQTSSEDVTKKYRITDNDKDSITLGPNDDLDSLALAPVAAVATGELTGSLTVQSETFKYKLIIDGVLGSEVTLTLGLGAPASKTMAEIAGLFDALDTDGVFTWGTNTAGNLTVTLNHVGGRYGFKITDGTFNALPEPGATHVFDNNTTYAGTDGKVGRIEFSQEFHGGVDGDKDLANADWLNALDKVGSPLVDLQGQDYGRVLLITPDTETATIEQAAGDLCDDVLNWDYLPLLPSSLTDSQAAANWWRLYITPNGRMSPTFPSYGYSLVHPFGKKGNYLQPLCGLVAGIEAAYAVTNKGYHKAPADTAARLDGRIKYLPTDDTHGEAVALDNALLNKNGIREVRHLGSAIFLFGDRVLTADRVADFWHKNNCFSFIGNEMIPGAAYFIFRVLNGDYYADLHSYVDAKMERHWKDGWFKGETQNDAYRINVSKDLNTLALQATGQSAVEIECAIVDTNERVTFILSRAGLTIKSA